MAGRRTHHIRTAIIKVWEVWEVWGRGDERTMHGLTANSLPACSSAVQPSSRCGGVGGVGLKQNTGTLKTVAF